MKLTTKTTKEQLKTFLGVNASAVKKADKDLYDELVYADKMLRKDEKKVTRKDLMDLAKAVTKVLGDVVKTPSEPLKVVAETSVKKKVAPKEDTVEEKPKKKLAKKTTPKKATIKKDEQQVKAIKITDSERQIQLAEMFPKTFTSGDEKTGVQKYELAEDIKTMKDLYNALINKEETIVFAYYWSKRHLRQFPYFGSWLGQPESFEHDLDLATAMYVSEELKVAYQVSSFTEAVYTILPNDFKEVDGVRVAGGIEFQIYRAV